MRTIVVLNAKGGSGKTTLATNLAGYYAATGTKTALADCDPQGSSLDWLAQRPDDRPPIAQVEAAGGTFRAPRGTEVMIMDAPAGTHEDQLATLLRRAHTAIIPVVPSPVDIRAAERFIDEISAVRAVVSNDVKLATVASRVRENTLVANDLEDFLFELRLPSGRKLPFLTFLRMSNNYLKAAERGLSIFEFAPAATIMDREYWNPLLRWLESPRSMPGDTS